MRFCLLLGALCALATSAAFAQPARLSGHAGSGAVLEAAGTWTGESHWLEGAGFAGGGYDGGALYAGDVPFGSTVPGPAVPPIRIDLDEALQTTARVYRVDDGFSDQGTGLFRGAAYDVSDPENPRRLNVVFTEDDRYTTPDNVWNPTTEGRGGREYLMVMASDYDPSGQSYAAANPFQDEQDAYYFIALRLREGYTLYESPAALSVALFYRFELSAERVAPGEIALTWDPGTLPGTDVLRLYSGTTFPADEVVADFGPGANETTFSTSMTGPHHFRLEGLTPSGQVVARSTEEEAHAIVSNGTALLGRLDPGSDSYADIWGYTDPASGREYALLCDRYEGLHIIDISGEAPVRVSGVTGYTSDAKDVKVRGQYAYLVQEYAPVVVIDLTDPANPQVVGQISTVPGGEDGAHNAEINGDYLYLTGGPSPGGLLVYDLGADPIDPPRVAEYQPTYLHDIHFNGDRAYASAIYDEGVFVLDVSDPAAPVYETQFVYPAAYMGAHNACSSEDGDYVYLSDEIGSGPWMRAFDVRDLDGVQLTAETIVNERTASHNCYVEGDFLFVAHYSAGLQVFDIGSDPAVPQPLAFYDTYEAPDRLLEGAWSVYPYFESGKVIVSDMVFGLFVIGVDGFTSVSAEPAPPEALALTLRAFPNPAAGQATLRYALPEAGRFRLALFDVIGREVAALAEGDGTVGRSDVTLDAAALGLAPGLYLARLDTPSAVATTRLTIAR